jgi:predicted Rossmann fold flavoprotein
MAIDASMEGTEATKDRREQKEKKVWDVAVLGGGAAGMMAAGAAAAKGARVILIEKNSTLGKKLLISGGGRCNVTNAEFDTRAFLAKFNGTDREKHRKDDRFLFSAFARFAVQDTIDFFNDRGMETKIEANQRVFPVSNTAQSVWDVLDTYMKEGGVTVIAGQTVKKIITDTSSAAHASTSDERPITSVILGNDQEIRARAFILATGGKSRPETGSTGDGFKWLSELGHSVSDSDAALVPVTVSDAWAKKLAGVTLDDIQLTAYQDEKRQARGKGRLLFTHVGVTGPTVLTMSRAIGELLKYGKVTLELDLLPKKDPAALHDELQKRIDENKNKKVKNVLGELVPSALTTPLLALAEIEPDTFAHSLTREKRLLLIKLIKGIPLRVKGLLGTDKAVVTSGGVALTEIDFKTMRSRVIPNLYVVGDLLNIHRPTGGYSLQLCWTTGMIAGISAAERV